MRVTEYSIYSQFLYNQQNTLSSLNQTNEQISTGTKIQYGYQDVNISVNTLRLDQEEKTLKQASQAAQGGLDFAQNSDSALNDMTTALTSFKTKLVNAANQVNGTTNLNAIADELQSLRTYMMGVANTSINGRYLFAGSAMGVKPIASDGSYMGNDQQVKALVDSQVQYAFNIDGKSLFQGQDSDYQKSITTNVPMKNQTLLNTQPTQDRYLTTTDTIKDMTGNTGDGNYTYFYVSGKTSDGISFKHIIQESVNSPISDLLSKIKNEFNGNVDVSLNDSGEIQITDNQKGSSQLEFNMVGYDNTVPLTKATAGLTAGSTSITVQDASGIHAGDVLNIEGIGQVQVASSYAGGGNTTIPLSLPLPVSKDQMVGDVNIRKVLTTTTTTTNGPAVGATSVNLTSVSGLNSGDGIVIGGNSYTVSSISGTTVNFAPPLTTAVTTGDSVALYPLPSTIPSGTNTLNQGVRITEFTRSGAGPRDVGNVTGSNDYWDHSSFGFNIELKQKSDNSSAKSSDLLSSVIGTTPTSSIATTASAAAASGASSITLASTAGLNNGDTIMIGGTGYTVSSVAGTTVNFTPPLSAAVNSGDNVTYGSFGITLNGVNPPATTPTSFTQLFNLSPTSTVGDYLAQVQQALDGKFGQNKFQVTLDGQGRLNVKDLSITADQKSLASSNLVGIQLLAPNNTFGSINGVETSRTNFDKNGSTLTGNVAQVIKSTNNFATPNDKLLDASGLSSLAGKTFTMSLTDKNGTPQNVTLSLGEQISASTASAASAIGTNTVTVASGASYAAGDKVVIGGNTYSVGSIAGNVLTLNSSLTTAVASGDSIPKIGNSSTFTYGISTASAASAIGTNTVTVASGASYAAGDKVVIGGNTYSVGSIAGNVLTLTSNLTTAVSSGDKISKTYEILDASNPQGYTPADKVTYRQLMDVMSMVSSGNLPSTTTPYPGPIGSSDAANYNAAIVAGQKAVSVQFDQNGRITLQDLTSTNNNTSLTFSMYDNSVNTNFSTAKTTNSITDNGLSLNSNTMLTLDDPHIDFFTQLQQAIDAVRSGCMRGDYTNASDERSTGMEGAITAIDHVLQHTIKKHTEVGAISNSFTSAQDRSNALQLNVVSVRSTFLDTDIATAASNLNQRMVNYQAMLSTIGKVTSLSLVNYLK